MLDLLLSTKPRTIKTLRLMAIPFLAVVLPVAVAATNPPHPCKPLTYLGVTGCELLPNQTCPTGYRKQAVGPTNPKTKAPTRLMCVPNKPFSKKRMPKS